MCPHKHWFVTYEKKYGGNVFMGNDALCKSISIGFVQIKMHNGVVRTLAEVHHVSKLNKNLVSMGTTDSKGFFLPG